MSWSATASGSGCGAGSVAEIAIVVADSHQRRGIGTALASAVTEDLVAHGVADIEIFSGSDNRAVARMVARAAPDARRQMDGPTMTWSFRARGQERGAASDRLTGGPRPTRPAPP